jgi:recombination protein RecT
MNISDYFINEPSIEDLALEQHQIELEQEEFMSNQLATQQQNPVQAFFFADNVQNELQKILGKNATSFTTSLVQIVQSNKALMSADPDSVLGAAMTAAINNNLGFAYIVPYQTNALDANGNKIPLLDEQGRQIKKDGYNQYVKETQAQFQIGYKGFIQLAQRTGQFRRINASAIYEGDSEQDVYERLTSFIPKATKGKVIGYIAYFELLNGFQAHYSMSAEDMEKHAKKYSQTYKNDKFGSSVWSKNFDEMAKKTVVKMLLSKQAPLSIDSQIATAVQADQAVIVDGQYSYIDNDPSYEPQAVQPIQQQLPCYDIKPLLSQIEAITTLEQVRPLGEHIRELSENPNVNLCGDDLPTLRDALTNKKSELQANALESVWPHEATAFTDKQMTEQAIDSVATPVSEPKEKATLTGKKRLPAT